MTQPSQLNRRRFVQTAAAAAVAGPLILSSPSSVRAAANSRINLGFIGVGTMGGGHVGGFLGNKDVQIVAICDVVKERREHHKDRVEKQYGKDKKDGEYKGCALYTDFRELLARKDIDAVVIATPDHWHAIPCIAAATAKKDIYCEKPLTHNIAEGRKIVEAVAKNQIIFQTGSQQRSEFGNHFRKAVEYVRSGRIGKLKTIRIGVGDPSIACDLGEEQAPEGTDWDLWLGPAPKRAFHHELCPLKVHTHFPAWRRYREYAGGGLADMGAHHFDIAQWALDMDNSGPVKIEPPKDEKAKRGLRFVYANGVEMFHDGSIDCEFIGTEGKILAARGYLKSEPGKILEEALTDKDYHVYPSSNHRQNWIDCIKSRKPTICTAEIGHRSATICHLGNIGYRLRTNLVWNPEKEQFEGSDEANKLVTREMREPWKL